MLTSMMHSRDSHLQWDVTWRALLLLAVGAVGQVNSAIKKRPGVAGG
jgi:hypothetical protein